MTNIAEVTILLPFRSVSVTIGKPASLRSDLADRLTENGDRFQRRMSDRFRENPHPHRYELASGYRITKTPVLAGLHRDYRLEKEAA
jgi:hypothetical protein